MELQDAGRRDKVAQALLRPTNFWDARKQKLGGYSRGMRQRFGIAVVAIGHRPLRIVAEPTAGLDPAERVRPLVCLARSVNAVSSFSRRTSWTTSRRSAAGCSLSTGASFRPEAEPPDATEEMQDRIWRSVIDTRTMASVARVHYLISSRLLAGRTVRRVHGNTEPDHGFHTAKSHLEDVYFGMMSGYVGECDREISVR